MFDILNYLIFLLFCGLGAYFDVINNKRIPNIVIYIPFVIGLLSALIHLNLFALMLAVFIGGISFTAYLFRQLGDADMYYFTALALLLPQITIKVISIMAVLVALYFLFVIVPRATKAIFFHELIETQITFVPFIFVATILGVF